MPKVPCELQGGCQCTAIRYRLLRPPIALYTCHCRDCQKQSSSAFGMSLWVEPEAFEFVSGKPQRWETVTDRGTTKICVFCGTCGSRLYHAGTDPQQPLSVKAGSLDDTNWLRPTSHLWTLRAQPWLAPALEDAPRYACEPLDDNALLEQWRAFLDP